MVQVKIKDTFRYLFCYESITENVFNLINEQHSLVQLSFDESELVKILIQMSIKHVVSTSAWSSEALRLLLLHKLTLRLSLLQYKTYSLRYYYTRRFHLNTYRKKNIAHKLGKTKINSLRFRFNLAHADNTKAFNVIASILLSSSYPSFVQLSQ